LLRRLQLNQGDHGISMSSFFRHAKISRQAFYKGLSKEEMKSDLIERVSIQIRDYRQNIDRRAGMRSLFYNLCIKEAYGIGVNKFEQLVSQAGLSLRPLRTKVVTTQSTYQSRNYPNLAKFMQVRSINKLVVGDLTYVSIGRYRFYLFCLTDVYSSRIVGYHISKTMKAVDALEALNQWVRLRGREQISGCMHHTDGGTQYFSKLYLNRLKDLKLAISVAQNCLENGYAEQRNGLIKYHLLPTAKLSYDPEELTRELKRIMSNYNRKRKQENLGWLSPLQYEKKWEDHPEPPTMMIK